MKQASTVVFALMMMTVSLAGCFGGDDGDSNDETPTDSLFDWQVHFAASAADLPVCNDDTNGRLYYVDADAEFQVCKTSGWEIIEITGPAGVTGTSGVNGTHGMDGQNGVDGTSILITIHNSTSCATGGNTFEIGSDSSSDGVLDFTEVNVIMDVCNGAQGPAGTNGTNGTNALNSLITSLTEFAGSNCANGGTRIDVGVDDNADSVLSASEIDQTQYVCNSSPYNNIMLTSITTHPASMACDVGWRVISHGLDNGDGGGNSANGVLESGEIDSFITYCTYISLVNSANPTYFTAVGNTVYFRATDEINGAELWKSDGTASGTVLVKDIKSGRGLSSNPAVLKAVGNTLYFTATDEINGTELWKSDGTTAGTVMVKDINNGSGSGTPSYLTAVGNTLYFRAYDGTNGAELWKSDGTEAGTVMVKDIYNGSGSSSPLYLTAVGNTLYFTANDGTNGTELWKSDGTGTVMVKDINNGSGSSSPNYLTAVGNTLYFTANDGTNGTELWKSDGTGTVMVKDINNGSGSGNPYYLTAVGNTLYFRAYDVTNGAELWKSDGTEAGTVMVKDIYANTVVTSTEISYS